MASIRSFSPHHICVFKLYIVFVKVLMGTDKQEWPGKLIEEECVKNRGEGKEKKEKKKPIL